MQVFPIFLEIFFFLNQVLSLLYLFGAVSPCKNQKKTNACTLTYSKTDYTDHRLTNDAVHYGENLMAIIESQTNIQTNG